MDNPEFTEDPVIIEVQQIREALRKKTRGFNSEELSRWYHEKAREIEERYYDEGSQRLGEL